MQSQLEFGLNSYKMKLLVWCLFIVRAYASTTDVILFPESGEHEKMVGGANAKPGAAPYLAALLNKYSGAYFCGGAIISARWILTAASCFAKSFRNMKILTGTQKLNSGGTLYYPKKFFAHPKHDRPKYSNDIGLIKLETPIIFHNATTQPIDYDFKEIPEGALLTIYGWGYLNEEGDMPNEMQTLNMTYIGYEVCKRLENTRDMDYRHVCTLNLEGEGVCYDDAGSPLTYNGKVVAVVNSVDGCAKGHPNKHARISYYHDFIRRTVLLN